MVRLRISCLLVLAAALPAQAILVRADRDDAEYLEMATKYASSVAIDVPGGGEGVLVQPRWILTSAQVAAALQAMGRMPDVAFEGRKYSIKEVRIYPTWRAGTPSSDLALLYLDRAVRGVAPTPPYRADDEGGRAVVIVGHGETGKIGAATHTGDGKKRGAINTVDRVAPKLLTLMVKNPAEASDLQGALGRGDVGGPAYLQEKDQLFVAGIASGAEGDAQLYVRVSAFVPWMDAIFLRAAKDELRDQLDVPGT
jgi:trypsin